MKNWGSSSFSFFGVTFVLEFSSFLKVGDCGYYCYRIDCKTNELSSYLVRIKIGNIIDFLMVGTDYSLNVFDGIIFYYFCFFLFSLISTSFYFCNLKYMIWSLSNAYNESDNDLHYLFFSTSNSIDASSETDWSNKIFNSSFLLIF